MRVVGCECVLSTFREWGITPAELGAKHTEFFWSCKGGRIVKFKN